MPTAALPVAGPITTWNGFAAYPASFSYHARSFEALTVDFLEQPLMEDVAEAMESTE